MYECDRCGKEFSDVNGAFIGKVSPPMYDRMMICKECCIKIEEEKKRQERKDNFLE